MEKPFSLAMCHLIAFIVALIIKRMSVNECLNVCYFSHFAVATLGDKYRKVIIIPA